MTLIGTDPEFFFTENNEVYPAKVAFAAAGVEPPLSSLFGDIIIDGAAIELNPEPGSPEILVDNMRELMFDAVESIESLIPQELVIKSVMPIDLKWAEDPELAVFGCDPDRSIWGRDFAPDSIDAAKHPWRYAGFHVHVSGVPADWGEEYILALDYTLGLANMAVADGRDATRREVYGKPGVYRVQPWGLEYRTPSSELMLSPVTAEFAFTLTKQVTENISMLDNFMGLIPERVLRNALQQTDPINAGNLYNIISTAVGLPALPTPPTENWKENWGVN